MKKLGFLLATLLLASTGWGQTSFTKYGPVNGIQMNTGATPYNFAAGITDIQSLLSASPGVVLGGATGGAKGVGSINATALFINGAAVGTSSGAVSSVGLSAPSVFGVTGSPVTAAGTLGLTFATGLTNHQVLGTGTTGQVGLIFLTSADIPALSYVTSVGLTAPTCFGVTGSPVTSAGTLALTLGSTTANFVRGDGTCSSQLNGVANAETLTLVGSATTSQSFGLFVAAGTNGSDLTYQIWNQPQTHRYQYMAGDGSWGLGFNGTANDVTATAAGNVTFAAPSSGQAVTINGAAGGANAININGSATTGQSNGLLVSAGTNASDTPFAILNHAQSLVYMSVRGDGSGTVGPTGNSLAWSAGGNVTVAAPTGGGIAFSATGVASQYAAVFTAGGTSGTQKGLSAVTTTQNAADKIFNVNNSASNLLDIFGDGHGDLGPNLNWTVAGAWSIGAPTSGTTLLVSGLNATQMFELSSTGANSVFSQGWNVGNTPNAWNIFSQGTDPLSIGTNGAQTLSFITNGSNRVTISGAGNIVANTAASGSTLTLSGTNGTALTLNGNGSGANAMVINGSATSGASFGLAIIAGTTSGDHGFQVLNQAGTSTYLNVFGDGGVVLGAPTGGDKGFGSINMQSCFVNNVACLTGSSSATHFAAGVITIAAGSCTVNQNTADISSCTFNSTGNVTVNFTTAFTSTTCVVNGVNSSPPFAVATQQGSPTTTASNVLMQSSSGVFVNGIFSIMCLGN